MEWAFKGLEPRTTQKSHTRCVGHRCPLLSSFLSVANTRTGPMKPSSPGAISSFNTRNGSTVRFDHSTSESAVIVDLKLLLWISPWKHVKSQGQLNLSPKTRKSTCQNRSALLAPLFILGTVFPSSRRLSEECEALWDPRVSRGAPALSAFAKRYLNE